MLEGIARALHLDESERAHLFDLVRATTTTTAPRRRPSQERVRQSVQQILDAIAAPADVRNERLDILAANRLGEAVYSPVFDFPARPVNVARFLFLSPTAPEFFEDWDTIAHDAVAILRTAHNVKFHRTGTNRAHHHTTRSTCSPRGSRHRSRPSTASDRGFRRARLRSGALQVQQATTLRGR